MDNNFLTQTVLFIGRPENAPDADLLPAAVRLRQEADAAGALAYLRRAPEDAPPSLLLIGPEQESAAVCRALQADEWAAIYPAIAILSDAACRTAALEAGAVDYLLTPLSPVEMETRLSPWLARQRDQRARFLRRLQEDVNASAPLPQALAEHLPDIAASFGASDIQVRRINRQETTPPHTLLFPLPGKNHADICLQLTFAAPPRLTPRGKQILFWLAEIVGVLLDIGQAQENVQRYATQSALLTLTFRLLSEQTDLAPLLDTALERTSMMMPASAASIWLLSADGKWLTLAASFSSRFIPPLPPRLPAGTGLPGWAAQLEKPAALDLLTELPEMPPAEHDISWAENGRYLLIAPLRRRRELTGFLIEQNETTAYSPEDTALIEEVAGLVANAAANALDLKTARETGEKQRILYQMSRQLTSSLEMDAILNRAAVWMSRLCPAEYSLLWLVDDSQTGLRLAAAFGLERPSQTVTLPLGEGRIGQAAVQGRILPDDPAALTLPQKEKEQLQKRLGISVRNLLAAPVTYQKLCIGVVALINKTSDACPKSELDMVVTASSIVAGAIGNAALYERARRLTAEKERSRQQAVQSARLAVVGRLTASLAHEINNPLQAVRGALTLALEESGDPEAVREYASLALAEVERVTQTVARMRRVYAAERQTPEAVDVGAALREAAALTQKELQRHKTSLQLRIPERPFPVWGYAQQLRLAFLNATLTLGDIMGKQGGGRLTLRLAETNNLIYADWLAAAPPFVTAVQKMLDGESMQESGFGISLCRDIVATHGGKLHLLKQSDSQILRIELPAHST